MGWVTALVAVSAAVAAAAPASAHVPPPVGPWDGQNPFRCVNQNVGTGTQFPDPNADPFCVEFDKTNQNVTDFGLVDFLSKEPARTAAAAPKCFYYQQDHWTGSIIQGQAPELWHWDGQYYFDKAKGTGGVAVHNFRIGGQPADPRPYVPDAYKPYFYPGGGGGVVVLLSTHPDPACAARVNTPKKRRRIYRGGGGAYPRCVSPGGPIAHRHVGRIALGMRRRAVRRRLGRPRSTAHRVDRWCLIGAATLRVAYTRRSHRVELVRTTARGQTARGVGAGTRTKRARRRLNLVRRFRVGRAVALEARRWRGSRLFVGARRGKVRWLALASRRPPRARVRRDLRRAA